MRSPALREKWRGLVKCTVHWDTYVHNKVPQHFLRRHRYGACGDCLDAKKGSSSQQVVILSTDGGRSVCVPTPGKMHGEGLLLANEVTATNWLRGLAANRHVVGRRGVRGRT